MHNLFNLDDTYSKGKFKSPILERLLKQQRASIRKAKQYYRWHGKPVAGSHPLVKLIYSYNHSIDADILDIYESATEKKEKLANLVGISNSYNKQEAFESIFYPECLDHLVLDSRMQVEDVLAMQYNSWTVMEPVRVLYQPYRLLAHHMPYGGKYGTNYSVIGIDIPMLMLMYAGWQQLNMRREDTEREGVEHFVGRWVLPNMLYSQADTTLLNIMASYIGLDREECYSPKPAVHITTYENTIEDATSRLLVKIPTSNLDPADFLKIFPNARGDGTLLDAMPVIHSPYTMAIYPIRALAYAPYIETVLMWIQDSAYLTPVANRMRMATRTMKNYGVISKLKPNGLQQRFEEMFNLAKDLLA